MQFDAKTRVCLYFVVVLLFCFLLCFFFCLDSADEVVEDEEDEQSVGDGSDNDSTDEDLYHIHNSNADQANKQRVFIRLPTGTSAVAAYTNITTSSSSPGKQEKEGGLESHHDGEDDANEESRKAVLEAGIIDYCIVLGKLRITQFCFFGDLLLFMSPFALHGHLLY